MWKILTSTMLTMALLISGQAFADSTGGVSGLSYLPPNISNKGGFGIDGAVKFNIINNGNIHRIVMCSRSATAPGCAGTAIYSESALLSMHAALLKLLGTNIPVWVGNDGVAFIGKKI